MGAQTTLQPTQAETSSAENDFHSENAESDLLKKAHRKVDKRLLVWYAFVYLIMRIHVSNISNTAIMNLEQGTGIKKQLGDLSSSQWAWALSIFYYPYMFFEPLATLALKRFSPSVWMSRIMITWVRLRPVALQIFDELTGCVGNHLNVSGCDAELLWYSGVSLLPWLGRGWFLSWRPVSQPLRTMRSLYADYSTATT
jgi:hypothetical protein